MYGTANECAWNMDMLDSFDISLECNGLGFCSQFFSDNGYIQGPVIP